MKYYEKRYETMMIERKEGIATVTLNRPEALNASNHQMSIERTEILEGITNDVDVKVLILTGGNKVFSAGGDLESLINFDAEKARAFSQRVMYNQRLLADMPKPTIAAISGYAYGGGFEQVLLCDLRIADESASFALPEINVGIFPGGGGTQRLKDNVSLCKAKELIFLGESIDAFTALELGLLNKVVPKIELETTVWNIAKKLSNKPLNALKKAKECLNASICCDINTGIQIESLMWSSIFGTEEQKTFMQSFLDSRKPITK